MAQRPSPPARRAERRPARAASERVPGAMRRGACGLSHRHGPTRRSRADGSARARLCCRRTGRTPPAEAADGIPCDMVKPMCQQDGPERAAVGNSPTRLAQSQRGIDSGGAERYMRPSAAETPERPSPAIIQRGRARGSRGADLARSDSLGQAAAGAPGRRGRATWRAKLVHEHMRSVASSAPVIRYLPATTTIACTAACGCAGPLRAS